MLSQLLFSPKSNSTHYVVYQQNAILDSQGIVDDAQVQQEGIPYMAASFAQYVLTENLAITATITHMLLYNWDDLKCAWSGVTLAKLRRLVRAETWMPWKKQQKEGMSEEEKRDLDPHYRLMLKYNPAPDWWFGIIFFVATAAGLVCIQQTNSGMQWWAFLIAISMAWVFILFIGAQVAITGFGAPVTSVIQMIGAYMEPGKPLANMYGLPSPLPHALFAGLPPNHACAGTLLSSAQRLSTKDLSFSPISSWRSMQSFHRAAR